MKKTACGKMKKWGLFLTVLVCCLFLGNGTQAEAASAKAKALKAYKSMLASKTKFEKYVGDAEEMKSTTFGLAYIDNDNVPELILNYYDEQYLFTFKNGKIKQIMSYYLRRLNEGLPFVYYKKKGVFGGTDFFEHDTTQTYYTLKSGKISIIGFKSIHEYRKIDTGWYTRGGKKISKAAFNKLLKKKVGNTKATIIKIYRANTAANRNKYLR